MNKVKNYEAPFIAPAAASILDDLLAGTNGNKEVNHSIGAIFGNAKVVEIKKPKKWVSLGAKRTRCRAAYNADFFYFAFDKRDQAVSECNNLRKRLSTPPLYLSLTKKKK